MCNPMLVYSCDLCSKKIELDYSTISDVDNPTYDTRLKVLVGSDNLPDGDYNRHDYSAVCQECSNAIFQSIDEKINEIINRKPKKE